MAPLLVGGAGGVGGAGEGWCWGEAEGDTTARPPAPNTRQLAVLTHAAPQATRGSQHPVPGHCLVTEGCLRQRPGKRFVYLKSASNFRDVDSLLQETLPPGPVEDGVYTYAALGLAGRMSELSIEQKRGYGCGFPHFA